MRYPCLVADHDDTVVDSTATVHFPCFKQYTAEFYPHADYTLERYLKENFHPGIIELFRSIGMSDEDMLHEQRYWNAYVKEHTPPVYPGMREILWRHKREGGVLCVVSHSYTENILRDYRENDLPEPDMIFGWESPAEERKPNPYPLQRIMEKGGFSPSELLVLDDLKPGYDMARSCGVDFAAVGWSNDIPEIGAFMRHNCDYYFKTVPEFGEWFFGEDF
ncbi:MAG: HAD family hydrolase [Clostridiales bacterium]|nr:HAD family hydrolase [Clostridiales bacterium]